MSYENKIAWGFSSRFVDFFVYVNTVADMSLPLIRLDDNGYAGEKAVRCRLEKICLSRVTIYSHSLYSLRPTLSLD